MYMNTSLQLEQYSTASLPEAGCIAYSNLLHVWLFPLQGEDREFIELLPLCVTYFIVFLYLAFSVGELKMFLYSLEANFYTLHIF